MSVGEPLRPGYDALILMLRSLLEAKHLHRIDPGRAPGRDPAGDEGDEGQHEGRPGEGQTVGGGDAEEEALENAARRGGGEQAGGSAGRDEGGTLPDDESDDVAGLRPEGHPDADLAPALGDGVAEQAVEAGHGDEKSEGREEAGEDGVEAWLRKPG